MLITIKTLQQQTFTVDIDETKTVLDLKKEIENKKGSDYGVKDQKLIYSGKILDDESALKEYNIEENKFIVVMVTKLKTVTDTNKTSTSTAQTSQPKTEQSSSKKTEESKEKSTNVKKETVKSTTPANVADPVTNPNDLEDVIRNIMEMGYPRDRVENALQASLNNPDRAVEYLMTGNIPSYDEELNDPLNNLDNIPVMGSPSQTESGGNPLEFLRNQAQFQQMCHVVQQNPGLLNTIMHQLRTSNPPLFNLISRNQQAFVSMLNEPATGAQPPENPPSSGTQSSTNAHIDSLIGSANVTPADKEAIERLKSLGFPEYLVIQAYFACEKNEDLAANFLITQINDE